MPSLVTAIDTLLPLFTFIRLGSDTISNKIIQKVVRWSVTVKAHSQFDNWT